MYNDILRKITSLTLLTILVASSAVVGLPNAMPQAHASTNANLFVSAENSQWNNYFAGPQVIQVVVADPDINRLDQSYGEPVVTVNGKRLRMAQATDGNWYAYFADRNQAIAAGKTSSVNGTGLNFGLFCASTSTLAGKTGVTYTDTKGFTIARDVLATAGAGFNAVNASKTASSTSITNNCITPTATLSPTTVGSFANFAKERITQGGLLVPVNTTEHVVRQNKTLNSNPSGFAASATYVAMWPVIQLYDFSAIPSAVTVDYQKNGGDQVVNLTFDRIPQNLISTSLDRSAYPINAAVLATINDPQLNIDPTEDDSWTWGASSTNNTLYYEAFTRNGAVDADGAHSNNGKTITAMQSILAGSNATALMFNHNGKLTINPSAQGVRVIDLQSNGKIVYTLPTSKRGDPAIVSTNSITAGSVPITFIETGGVNTGVFVDYDSGKKSEIMTVNNVNIRGQSATVRYNDISASIVGGFSFASVTQSAKNNTWASGQRIPVTLTDNDANKNSKLSERLFLYDPTVDRLSTLKIGTPFSLSSGSPSTPNDNATIFGGKAEFSNIGKVGIRGIGSFVKSLGSANSTASGNLASDESFSFRPIFNFTNSTTFTPGSKTQIENGTLMVVDLKTNAKNLFSTINNPQGSTSGKFKGFDFINYDLRSFSGLSISSGALTTGATINKVQIFLVNATSSTGSVLIGGSGANNGLLQNGAGALNFISIANVTNLQGFVNLNGTQPTTVLTLGGQADSVSKTVLNNIFTMNPTNVLGIAYQFQTTGAGTGNDQMTLAGFGQPLVTDFFSIGITGDGTTNAQRINNGIYRFELEETGDNTGTFTGTNQYVMLNQLNIFDPLTYSTLRPIQHDVKFAAIQDMLQSEARAPQVTYLDLGQDGVNTQISAQQDIPTHTGVISFDSKTYKIGDTVTITLKDQDLNVDNDLIDIYTTVARTDASHATDLTVDTVGKTGLGTYSDGRAIGRLVDVQFGQQNIRWSNAIITGDTNHQTACTFANANGTNVSGRGDSNTGTAGGFATSLGATGFSLVETGPSTGIFTGTFEIPDQLCVASSATQANNVPTSSVGQNIKVNYVDFRDDSGKLVEVSDNAGIKGNTGSVKLDKAVYPVPFGAIGTSSNLADFSAPATTATSLNGVFPLHRDIIGQTTGGSLIQGNVLTAGEVLVHIRVNDQDYNTSPTGTDHIAVGVNDANHGPVAFQITRQSNSMLLATAGGPAVKNGKILNLNGTSLKSANDKSWSQVRDLGPMTEIAPDAGIFQADLPIRLTDGPAGNDCPAVDNFAVSLNGSATTFLSKSTIPDGVSATNAGTGRFYTAPASGTGHYCVRQGDVLTVTYTDTNDASGHTQTVTDSSTFDLRNGVLQSDKSVYIIGSDMILTLVEPDLNLDSQTAETAPLDLIEWDSHAFKGTMGPNNNNPSASQITAFDPKPNTFVETGKDTGIFQSVIKIPKKLNGNLLERGEQIHLEYTDWGPAGSKTVGANSQDIQLTIYTSNFGATVELDQKVYTWTDRVYITVVAPDHNFDPNLIDIIGDNDENKVTVSTRGNSISNYKLVETGVDTGIFTGYVILQGDKSIKDSGGVDGSGTQPTGAQGVTSGTGPTDGFLPATEQDGVSVSFEFTRDQTVTGSALIRWNIGEIKWLEASYPANGQGVLQIVDPDMNLNPKAVDKFDTNVWSDSDAGGIKLTMTETGESTGIFQGTVYFTTNFQSSGNRLHVAEGDTVTGEYRDRTLPPPYTPSDQLRLTSTTFIGTIVPPLERAPASNPRIVDSFGNAITGAVKAGQQIQITADLTNGQDRDQPFAYLVQIQDANGVTVSLSWITGTLTAGQSLNPAQSWTPQSSGTYTAQIFVWQSIDNPNALSPPLSTTINVA